jgi:orotidine-5'-phosphate decarboxylase
MESRERIIVALDKGDPRELLQLALTLQPYVGCFKIGLQFIYSMVASIVLPIDGEVLFANVGAIRDFFEVTRGKLFWDGKNQGHPEYNVGGGWSGVKLTSEDV